MTLTDRTIVKANKLILGLAAASLLVTAMPASATTPMVTQAYSTPTNTFASPQYQVTRTAEGLTFDGKVVGVDDVTLRVSASPITTQTGWYYYGTATADDTVKITADEQGTGKALYWQIEDRTDRNNVLVSGQVAAQPFTTGSTPAPAPSPTPTTDPTPTPTPTTDANLTGGSGGALTNRLDQSFTNSAGVTSKYHIFAEGLDWSKKVGIMYYTDGSGEYGLNNPNGVYLLEGATGLKAVAKKHNMVLVTPKAPGGGCDDGDGVCWYDSSGSMTASTKVKWSADLLADVYKKYNIDKSRVAFGGYSSGAEWTSTFFGAHHAPQFVNDGVAVAISFGGRPYNHPAFPAGYKSNVHFSWNTGSNDSWARSSVDAGEAYYRNQGFSTSKDIVSGVTHDRYNYSTGVGHFGAIMDKEITEHVKPA